MENKATGHKILIIDDDSFLLDMYALKFTQKGFHVMSASGSSLALQKLRDGEKPDVLLVDLVMPTMDGFAFLDQVKKEKLVPGALAIVLSNLGQREDIDRAAKLGAAGYIVKASATPTEVVDRVTEEIDKQKGHKK